MTESEELSEDQAWEIALRDHSEYRRAWEEGTLPDEILDDDGNVVSPRLHLEMHAMVERQLAADDPKGVVAVAEELEQLGLSRHEIRHEIARPIANQMWHMLSERRDFDEQQYLSELQGILESHR